MYLNSKDSISNLLCAGSGAKEFLIHYWAGFIHDEHFVVVAQYVCARIKNHFACCAKRRVFNLCKKGEQNNRDRMSTVV